MKYRLTAGIVVSKEGKILCGKMTNRQHWSMPQGGVEQDETVFEAAKRELWEEVGIKPEMPSWDQESQWYILKLPIDFQKNLYKKNPYQKYKWFLATVMEVPTIVLAMEEYEQHAWFTPDEILEFCTPHKAEMYRNVLYNFGLMPEFD